MVEDRDVVARDGPGRGPRAGLDAQQNMAVMKKFWSLLSFCDYYNYKHV